MAKVKGPLMSFSAKGQFGNGAINFQGNKGETQVRHLRKIAPKAPSAKQTVQRDIVAFVVKTWKSLHFVDVEHWRKSLGDPRGYRLMKPYYTPRNGYHIFLRRNLSYLAWGQFCVLSPFSEMTASPEVSCSIETAVTF